MKKNPQKGGGVLLIPESSRTFKNLVRMTKLTLFCFLLGLTQVMAVNSYSQGNRFSIKQENQSLERVLSTIEDQTNYFFIYNRDLVDVDQVINVDIQSQTIVGILEKVLENTNIRYSIVDRQIVLSNETIDKTVQQQRTVSGKVTATSGESLPGVTVVVKGTTNGTITDENGNFTVGNVSPGSVLIFSFVGMKQLEILTDGKSVFDVTMTEESIGIDEVVAIGYGTRKKSDLTGAVSSVSADYLKEQPVADVSKALQGSTSGVRVIKPASPGAQADIRIRGMGTINNNQPLWVVDGVVGANPPSPNEIESIEVLKDASSTAIYGSRGASGVILVTTKSGKANQAPKLDFSIRTGFSAPRAKFDVMTDPQLIGELLWLEMKNDGLTPSHAHFGSGAEPKLNDYLYPNGANEGDPGVNPALYDQNSYPITRSNPNGTDWMGALYQDGVIQDYNLSVAGGSEKTNYAFTAGYLDEEGILKFTSYQRLSIRANIDSKLNDWLTVGQRLGATYGQHNGYQSNNYRENLINKVYIANPIVPMYDIAGNYAGSVVGGNLGDWENPLAGLDRDSDDKRKDYDITGNIYAQVKPLKGLTVKSLLGYDVSLRNNFDVRFPEPEYSQGVELTTLTEGSSNNTLWNWTNTAMYEKEIGAHSFDILLGVEATKNQYRYITASRQDFFSQDVNFLVLGAGATNQQNDGSGYSWTLFSTFGRAHYVYNNKYLVDFTIRRDGSSRFGTNNKYGVFPAFAAGWVVSEENFMGGTSGWLDYLKVRASWGQSGNDRIGNYNSYYTYGSGLGNSYYAIAGGDNTITQGYQSTAVGNPNAKWETTTSTNIAFDGTLLKSLDFSIDLWKKKTEDMLFPVAIPLVAGSATAPSVNIGTMQNTGVDITLGYKKTVNNDLSYNVSGTVSHYKNEVLKLSGNVDEYIAGSDLRGQTYTRTEIGHAFPEYFGYIIDGIFQTQPEADAHATNGSYNQPGNLKVRDIAGAFDADGNPIPDGKITPDDRTYIGSPHPDFTASMRVGIDFKGFDFSASFYASVGNDLVNYTSRFIKYGLFDGANSADRLFKSWGSPYLNGDNSKATMPKASTNQAFEQNASTIYIEDGSFLRLQNAQIGYSLPKAVVAKAKLQNVRLYIMGSNLFTITNYSGLDPEVISGNGNEINMGIDLGSWPVSRQFMFGVDITL